MNKPKFNITLSGIINTIMKLIFIKRSGYALLILFLLFSCNHSDMFTISKYPVGSTGPGGGIVFYITPDGHGLEAAQNDLSNSFWSNVTVLIGNTSTAIGTGLANTDAIIAQAGHIASAAKTCRDYTGGGKSDWFLPSLEELRLMYVNLKLNGLGGFMNTSYWSSSENLAADAYWINFIDGTTSIQNKDTGSFNVRAVRAF